ncbi:MAG: YceD family protein [Saprospiraceae bacterium]
MKTREGYTGSSVVKIDGIMNPLLPYILPLKGLNVGIHQYHFEVDNAFFGAFEDSPLREASVQMEVVMDKQPRLLTLEFSFSGWVGTLCDRCMASIHLPIVGENRLLVKYGEPIDDLDDDDVVYIPAETSQWSIAQFVYEYILLSIPMVRIYDCEKEDVLPCDEDMLDKIDQFLDETDESDLGDNPFKDFLKKWENKPE